jgi:hypothetical protein
VAQQEARAGNEADLDSRDSHHLRVLSVTSAITASYNSTPAIHAKRSDLEGVSEGNSGKIFGSRDPYSALDKA